MRRAYISSKRGVFLSVLVFVVTTVLTLGLSHGAGTERDGVNISYPYAINLLSSRSSIDPASLPSPKFFSGYRLYKTEHRDGKGVLWHRLRLGFFPSKRSAEVKLARIKGRFSHAWIAKVRTEERSASGAGIVVPGAKARARRGRDAVGKEQKGKGLWAVTLFLSPKPVKPGDIPKLAVLRKHRLYTMAYRGKAASWHILRMGFFPTRKSATGVRDALISTFPQAMVTRVPPGEKKKSAKNIILPAGASLKRAPIARKKVTLSKKTSRRVEAMIKDAKKAMTGGNNKEAIGLLTRVLKFPENKYSPDALELLGLAYERSGKTAKAEDIYREYLMFYPGGEDGRRVGQRLAGLETARDMPKKRLTQRSRSRDVSELYGTLSQFYNRDSSYTDIGGSVLNRSSLSTDLDLTYRKRTADYELRSVFIGGYEYDFLDDSEGRINRLYLDVMDRNRNVSGRVGRQWYSTGGVLGRFDGALLSFAQIPRVKFNLVAGFPADSGNLSSINTDKSFLGLNADLGTLWKHWDFNVFGINQRIDGITDRRAVGGEARFNYSKGSYFSLLDYDVSYSRLNTFLFVGNWLFSGNKTINLSADYRQTPSLSTSNALIGQSIGSISELLSTMSEDDVRALALDRTAGAYSLSLGGATPLNDKYQLSGTVTVSEQTGTEASGGVAKVQGTGPEYFYSLQLIANNVLIKNDLVIAGLRYSDTGSSNTMALSLNSRFTLKRDWRINPRILFDYSTNNTSVGSQYRIRPTLRTEYHWKKRVHLEFEGGLEWVYDRTASQTDYSRDYFIITGYRWDF